MTRAVAPGRVRTASPEDGPGVDALLASWLGEERVRRRRGWLARNPHGAPRVWTATDDDGVVVGTTSIFPRRFAVGGAERVGAIGGDAYVRPDRRRGGLARALHEATLASLTERDVAFMFGPPVPQNLAALLAAGSRVVGRLVFYRRPLPAAAVAAALGHANGQAPGLGDAITLGDGASLAEAGPLGAYDEVWERARRWHAVAGVRDAAFVRWRYLDAPTPARVHVLRRDGRAAGWLASVRVGSRLVVLDLLAASPDDLDALARGAIALGRRTSCTEVATRLNPKTPYARALERRGFLRGRSRQAFQVLSRSLDERLFDPRGWHLTYGDEDVDDVAAFLAGAAQPPPARARRRRLLCLIDGLEGTHGGTEGQMAALLARLPKPWSAEVWTVQRSRFLARRGFVVPWRSLGIRSLTRSLVPLRLAGLAGAVRAGRFDLLQTFQFDASVLGPILGAMAGVPVVVSRRDLGFWQTPLRTALLQRTDRLASRVIANCAAVARHAVETEHVPSTAVEVVWNGHDAKRFDAPPEPGLRERLGIEPEAPVVALVANLKPLKRQADLVDALARLGPKAKGAHVLLVGTGPGGPQLLARAQAAGVGGRVHVVPAPEGVVGLLRHAQVGVLCSDTEGLSNAVIEYLACSLPVVASSVGGNPDLVTHGENGYLYPPGDVVALATALKKLLQDPARAAEMGRKGRARFEASLTAERMVGDTVAAYERVLAERAPASRLAVEAVTRLDGLEPVTPAWRALARGRFFVGPRWTTACLRERGADPFVVVARDRDGAVVGVLPLRRAAGGAVETCGTEHGAVHFDVAAAAGREAEVASAVLDFLAKAGLRRVRLRRLAEDGALRRAVRARAWSIPFSERHGTTCAYLETRGRTFAQYLREQMSHQRRYRLEKRRDRLLGEAGAEIVRVVDPTAVAAAMDELLALHRFRSDAIGRSSDFDGAGFAFHRALAQDLARDGELSLLLLRRGGRAVAAQYGAVCGSRLHLIQVGLDPADAALAPGIVLLLATVEEDVFGRGLTELDFLDGMHAYKLPWATGVRREFDLDLHRPTALGRLSCLARGLVGLAATTREIIRSSQPPPTPPADD